MSKEVENKLDEDFLFYLGFTTGLVNKFENMEEFSQCQLWLHKLLGQRYSGVEEKKNRNIYLSQMVLCVEEGKLTGPFLESPNEVDISNALDMFGPTPTEITEPEWLKEIKNVPESVLEGGSKGDNGRTYLATKTLPNGQGAFAYLAVSLDDDLQWIDGRGETFDKVMEEKFAEKCPARTEAEEILALRKDPEEIQRVIAFYEGALKNIADEMDGVLKSSENDAVNYLIEQLTNDLMCRGEYDELEKMNVNDRRIELLHMLHDRINCRINTVKTRQDALGDLQKSALSESFFNYSMSLRDKISFPAAMWQAVINKDPSKKHITQLQEICPPKVLDKFIELLSNEKEEIAVRMQRRHESIVSQMKKELRKEAEKGQKWVDEVKEATDQFYAILLKVRERKEERDKVLEEEAEENGGVTEKTTLYEQMKKNLIDTQRSVEDEAEFGRQLAAEINVINNQTEQIQHINKDSIMKVEEANMNLMRNITRLRIAIQQYETKIKDIQKTAQNAIEGKSQNLLLF